MVVGADDFVALQEQLAVDVATDKIVFKELRESGACSVAASEETPEEVVITEGSNSIYYISPRNLLENTDGGGRGGGSGDHRSLGAAACPLLYYADARYIDGVIAFQRPPRRWLFGWV